MMKRGAGKRAGAFPHRLEIAPRGEGFAGSGQDGAAHAAIGIDAPGRLGEQFAVAFLAERIARFRPLIVSVTTMPDFSNNNAVMFQSP